MTQFSFGKNWTEFSRQRLDRSRIEAAQRSLDELIGKGNISGKTFLDIGCGSGLFSLAAARTGAKKVVGFDSSQECVRCAEQNKNDFYKSPDIRFFRYSVLDPPPEDLGKFDIVYSWGVLHHTGQMWRAINNASSFVKANGTLVIALYNKHWSSPIWAAIKRLYNNSCGIIQKIIIAVFYPLVFAGKFVLTFKNPLCRRRGMDFYYDLVDWVGGYPYQYASLKEVEDFVKELGFDLIKSIPAAVPTGNNEFVFVKRT